MNRHRWWGLSMLSVAALATCDGATPVASDAGPGAGRAFRGTLPASVHGRPISRVFAIDAKTGRTVASAVPNAQGQFNLDNLPKGATYRFAVQVDRASIPLVFPRQQGGTQRTNLFNVGARTSRVGSLDGPIDVGAVRTTIQNGETQITPRDPARAPNLQEDIDNDGMPDAADPDVDGDGTPNAMDMDNDGDGMPDNAQFNDQDGDGVTNESDPDTDGDGTPNAADMDNDNDGTPDAMDTAPSGGTVGTAEDSDGDGVPNTEDTGNADTSRVTLPGRGGRATTPAQNARAETVTDPDFDAQLDPMNRPMNADPVTGEVRTPSMFMLPGATALRALNQGGASSCAAYAMAAAATLLRYRYESEGDINTRVASTGYLYARGLEVQPPDSSRPGGICDGESSVSESDLLDILVREGAPLESEYPFAGTSCPPPGNRQVPGPTPEAGPMAYRFRIGGWQWAGAPSRAVIREQIAAGNPVVVGVSIPANFGLEDDPLPGNPFAEASAYVGGQVYRSRAPDDWDFGHIMLIVGYDDSRGSGAFRVRNSYGQGWGDGGAVWWDYADLEAIPDARTVVVTPLPAAPQPFVAQDPAAFRTDLAILGRPVLRQADGQWRLTLRVQLREPANLRRVEVTPTGSATPETQDFNHWVSYGNVTVDFATQPASGPASITLRFRLFEQTKDVDVVRMITIPAPEANPTGMD